MRHGSIQAKQSLRTVEKRSARMVQKAYIDQFYDNANDAKKMMDATAMIPVAAHPITTEAPFTRNFPIILQLLAMSMMSAITGTATIAFRTDDQISALTGLMDNAFAPAPSKVAAAIAP